MMKVGGQPLDFYQFPCVSSSLTCVCPLSEHFSNERYLYRRFEGNGIENVAMAINFFRSD